MAMPGATTAVFQYFHAGRCVTVADDTATDILSMRGRNTLARDTYRRSASAEAKLSRRRRARMAGPRRLDEGAIL